MKFLIDAMLPPAIAASLNAAGHDAVSALSLGKEDIPDSVLIEFASTEGRVIVTENPKDFAHVRACPVLIVLKRWWPRHTLGGGVALALQRWANANPDPDSSARWLDAEFR